MTTKAERRAKLLQLARDASTQPAPQSAKEAALQVVARKLSLERFKAMFRSFTQASAYVRDELGVNTASLDTQEGTDQNWLLIYEASLAVEAQQFSDPLALAPPDRPRKTREQTLQEKEWERELARMSDEDQRFTSNGGPTKYGASY